MDINQGKGTVKLKGRFMDVTRTLDLMATTWPETMPNFFALVSVVVHSVDGREIYPPLYSEQDIDGENVFS